MVKELEDLKKLKKDYEDVLKGKKDALILDDTEAYTEIFKEEDFKDKKK